MNLLSNLCAPKSDHNQIFKLDWLTSESLSFQKKKFKNFYHHFPGQEFKLYSTSV